MPTGITVWTIIEEFFNITILLQALTTKLHIPQVEIYSLVILTSLWLFQQALIEKLDNLFLHTEDLFLWASPTISHVTPFFTFLAQLVPRIVVYFSNNRWRAKGGVIISSRLMLEFQGCRMVCCSWNWDVPIRKYTINLYSKILTCLDFRKI